MRVNYWCASVPKIIENFFESRLRMKTSPGEIKIFEITIFLVKVNNILVSMIIIRETFKKLKKLLLSSVNHVVI